MLTSPEFWVSLGTLILTVVVPILAFVFKLSSKLTAAVVAFELIGKQQSAELTAIKDTIDQMRAVLATIAVDRERVSGMDRRNDDRFRMVEQAMLEMRKDINNLKRGIGRIQEPDAQ